MKKIVFNCRERCCGTTRQCLPSCLNVTCEDSDDCDGLTCCNHKCQTSTECPTKKPSLIVWLSAWLTCIVLVVAMLLGFCCCLKRRTDSAEMDSTYHTELSDAFMDKSNRSVSLTTVVTWASKESILA